MSAFKQKAAIPKGNNLKKSLIWGVGTLLFVFIIMTGILLYKYAETSLDMNQLLETAEFQNYLISDDGTLTSETSDPIIIVPTGESKKVKAVEIDIEKMSTKSDYNGQIFFASTSLWEEKSFVFRQGLNEMLVSSPLCKEELDYVRLDVCEMADVNIVVNKVVLNSRIALVKHSFKTAVICALIIFLLIYIIYYNKSELLTKKTILEIITYIYAIIIIFLLKVIPSITESYTLKILTCILSFFMSRDIYKALIYYKKHNVRKHMGIIVVLFSLIISFSLVGNNFFYSESMGYFETSMAHIFKYFLVFIYSLLSCITIPYWITCITIKNEHIEKDIRKNIFLIFLTSGLIYLVAYNPANMFPDTYLQLRQVFGIDQFSDWHPVFHTLILKFFISIFKTPFVFALFHIVLFSYVMTKWLMKLHSKGLNKKIIYLFSCSFYWNIAYGLLITNIWKDNLYNICLIWCTYLIYNIVDDFESFNENKINYVYFFLSVTGIFCCRHNGIIPIISIIIFLAILFIKNKTNKKICLLCFLFVAVIFAKKPLYKMLDVLPNEPGVMYTPLVHDIVAVIVYNNGNTLSDSVMDEMESILSVEQWKSYYDSTDSDPYTFHCDAYMENLNKKSAKEIVMTYLNALKDEPLRIVSARLMSSQIMWSTFKRNGSLDYLYEENNTFEIKEEFGYTRKENILTEFSNRLYDIFENSKVLNTIFFRTGIWFCILLLSITTIIIYSKRLKLLLVLVPVISNMISLAVSMTCQHLRYVWALYIISILFLFVVVVDKDFEEE